MRALLLVCLVGSAVVVVTPANAQIFYLCEGGNGKTVLQNVPCPGARVAESVPKPREDALSDANAAYDKGDYAQAIRLLRPIAEKGNALAQYNLGMMHANGQGVPQDFHEAVKWYRLAAVQGNARAQTNLGAMYAIGRGVPQDFHEAEQWWRLAAAQGNADAQNNLSTLYSKGQDGRDPVAYGGVFPRQIIQGQKLPPFPEGEPVAPVAPATTPLASTPVREVEIVPGRDLGAELDWSKSKLISDSYLDRAAKGVAMGVWLVVIGLIFFAARAIIRTLKAPKKGAPALTAAVGTTPMQMSTDQQPTPAGLPANGGEKISLHSKINSWIALLFLLAVFKVLSDLLARIAASWLQTNNVGALNVATVGAIAGVAAAFVGSIIVGRLLAEIIPIWPPLSGILRTRGAAEITWEKRILATVAMLVLALVILVTGGLFAKQWTLPSMADVQIVPDSQREILIDGAPQPLAAVPMPLPVPPVSNVVSPDPFRAPPVFLSSGEELTISMACAPLQMSGDVLAYRNCISQQRDSAADSPSLQNFSDLPSGEQLAIQMACGNYQISGNLSGYRACIRSQLQSIGR